MEIIQHDWMRAIFASGQNHLLCVYLCDKKALRCLVRALITSECFTLLSPPKAHSLVEDYKCHHSWGLELQLCNIWGILVVPQGE